ncbi:hypothetical protein DPMN_061831 [Dreissena polymorpha]|uniref:Uncharacterized protein n=1 Tax=Dreissena polymorpha TaxID=45954 RepID=A0A9D4C7R0_DREPO|nr:hypothetical protein DPMN_061831 [Dreissena polymorpha]
MLKLAQTDRPTDRPTDQQTDQQTNRQGKNNMSPTTIVGDIKMPRPLAAMFLKQTLPFSNSSKISLRPIV